MLAPRKTLWTTPREAVAIAADRVRLTGRDTLVDVGCGDGRVIMWWAMFWAAGHQKNDSDEEPAPSFIGIDIAPERIAKANDEWSRHLLDNPSLTKIDVQFHCANALQHPELWLKRATVIFVYLIPRGLRILAPILTGENLKNGHHDGADLGQQQQTTPDNNPLHTVISFMNRVPNTTLVERLGVQTLNQPDAIWPLYIHNVRQNKMSSN